MEEILKFIESEKERYLSELITFLKIPSVSSVQQHKKDIENCSNWLAEHIKSIGFKDVQIIPTEGHPIVFAQWLEAEKSAPTILVYGHYDVQPVEPLDLWDNPPFEPVIKNGKIWARGSSDDKGQLFVHLKALEAYFKIHGKLPVNVKLLFEGEEECGSSHLDEFVINHKELLACDTVIVSDSEWYANDMPSICYGMRGISYFEITVTGPDRDLHSGTYGGGIDNPLNVLCWMITQLKDSYGRIKIDGFYDDVIELLPEERDVFKKLPYNEKDYCDDLSINAVNGEFGYTTIERVWIRPSLDLNGIIGGYTGEGAKTVLPSKATAKFSCRLVPNQKSEDIGRKIEKHLRLLAPPTVKVEITNMHGGDPFVVPMDSQGVKAGSKAFELAFGKETVFMRDGGSIPIVGLFDEVLNAPSVLLGLGLPGDNIHSPNESYALDNYYGGIKTSVYFFDEISKANR